MSDLGNPKELHETLLFATLVERAEAAMAANNWILCATLCRALAELELDAATITHSAAPWNGATRAVPLLKVPMRDEAPRPASAADTAILRPVGARFTTPDGNYSFDATDGACGTCGVRGKPFTELLSAGTLGAPDQHVDGATRWKHVDQLGYPVPSEHPFTLGE